MFNRMLVVTRFVAMLVLGAATLTACAGPPRPTPTPVVPHGLTTIVRFGDGELANAVTDGLAGHGIQVQTSGDLTGVHAASDTAVIFDGAWFAAHHNHPEMYRLLHDVTDVGAPVLVIGHDTSLLFDALMAAGVDQHAAGRNPAYTDPPQAGFMLRCEGGGCSGARLFSNSTDPHTLVDAIGSWYNQRPS